MSFNISDFKVKKLSDFSFSLNDIKTKYVEVFGDDDDLDISEANGVTTVCFLGGPEIIGVADEQGTFAVSELSIHGDWSGTVFRDILKPVFTSSKGQMEAVLIWEGGEQIQRVTVSNGNFTETEIDL